MRGKNPLFGFDSTGRHPLPGSPKMGEWGRPNVGPLSPVVPVTPEQMESQRWKYEHAVPVLHPRSTEAPEGARTLSLRRIITVAGGATNVDLMAYVCLPAASTVFYWYSLVLPAGAFPDVEWLPTIDEQRIFGYHGSPGVSVSPNPTTNLNVSTGSDFSSVGLVRCQVLMQPNQTLRWRVSNNTGAPVQMGVRMDGYVDLSQMLMSSKFGD